jgi:transcriptional regulator
MAAANRQWRSFDGQALALAIFSGPHAYVSPTLYPDGGDGVPAWHYSGVGAENRHAEPALPTWNYVAVHVHGVPKVLEDKGAALAAQVRFHEREWDMARLPAEFSASKQARVVAFEIPVARIEGKAKLGQRQAPDERAGVAQALAGSADSGVREIAEMMKRTR